MQILGTIVTLFLCADISIAQSDEHEKFKKNLTDCYNLTEKEADECTQILSEARKDYESIFTKAKKIVSEKGALILGRGGLLYLREEMLLRHGLNVEQVEKTFLLIKEAKEKVKDSKEKLKETLPSEKFQKLQWLIQDWIVRDKLVGYHQATTNKEKVKEILGEMNIQESDKKEKVSEILKTIFRLKGDKNDIKAEMQKIGTELDAKDKTEKIKKLLNELIEKHNDILKVEYALLELVTPKQYLSYLKKCIRYSPAPPHIHDLIKGEGENYEFKIQGKE